MEPNLRDETNRNSNLSFIDLFAGIGGFHYALHRLGLECVFAAEFNEMARKTYTENFKNISPHLFDKDGIPTPLFAWDITEFPIEKIPDHDILCAGFPCQPFSQAGFKLGFDDTRGTLFFDIANIIKNKKPKAFFLENVRGLRNHDNGRTFATIERVINELGYSFHHKIVSASDFNLPQLRPRIFMVGFRNDINDVSFEFPEPVERTISMSDVFDGAKVNREIGFTLRVGGKGSSIEDRRNWDAYYVNGEVRRIGPKEGKRMQGFPDSFIFPVSKAEAMKQLGNSVAINAIEAVARKIIWILESQKNGI
jgi:DNA (cytosine-5)-methyltransferase 1